MTFKGWYKSFYIIVNNIKNIANMIMLHYRRVNKKLKGHGREITNSISGDQGAPHGRANLSMKKKHSWWKERKMQKRIVAMTIGGGGGEWGVGGWTLRNPQVIKRMSPGHSSLRAYNTTVKPFELYFASQGATKIQVPGPDHQTQISIAWNVYKSV